MEFKSGMTYTAHHKPSGEDWVILGVDTEVDQVCVAGWPPTMANLSDCENFIERSPLTKEERDYRREQFGQSKWL